MSIWKRFRWPSLTIRTKLLLLVGVLATVATLIGLTLIQQQRAALSRTHREAAGVEYLSQVQNLLDHVMEHRALAYLDLETGQDNRQRLSELQGLVESEINSLSALQRSGLQLSETLETIQRNWSVLVTRSSAMNAQQSYDAHSRLIEDLGSHALQAGESSGLRTTPEPAAFYLTDTLLERLIPAADNLGRLQAGAVVQASQPSDPSILPEGFDELSGLVDTVAADSSAITDSLELAFAQGQGLRQEVEPTLQVAERQAGRFLESVRGIMAPGTADEAPAAQRIFGEGSRAVASMFDLSRASLATLDRLVDSRLTRLQQQTLLTSVALGLALLLGIGLAALIIRGLTRQIDAITQTFSVIGIGDFSARVKVTSRDELGRLSNNLNAMLDNTLDLIQTAEERDRIQESIRQLLEEVAGVAEGDLTAEAVVTAEVTGAIADSFNFMIEQLRKIIREVQETTGEVATSAREVQGSAVQLAEGSSLQARQVVGASGHLDQMVASIRQVAVQASEAGTVAREALSNAQQGNRAVANTIQGMQSIRQHVQETTKRMKRLGESSQEIGEIVQLIGEIADRTSMLALNASIQAAMAGEAGQGFAVVAEEIERLAERSNESSKRIEALIKGIQIETGEAVTAMEKTTQEVVSGSQIANQAGQSLAEIETVSNVLANLVNSINASSQAQAEGSEGVARSMNEVSRSIQSTAAGTQQAAAAVRGLADLADRLCASVSTFRLPETAGPRPVAAVYSD